MSKNNVNPNHYKVAGREGQGEDIAQTRNKQRLAESVARRRSGIGAKSQKPASQTRAASPAAAPTPAAKPATRKARATPRQTPPGRTSGSRPAPALTAKQATKQARVNLEAGADKRGIRSTAQKRAAVTSHHEFDPMPQTKPVSGAFGKEPSPRRRAPRKE